MADIDLTGMAHCCCSSSSSGCTTVQNCCDNPIPCVLNVTVEGCINLEFQIVWNGIGGWYGHGGDSSGINLYGQLSCSGGEWFGLPFSGSCGDGTGYGFELYPCGPSGDPPCVPSMSVTCDPFQIQWTEGYVNTAPSGGCCDQATGIVVTITE